MKSGLLFTGLLLASQMQAQVAINTSGAAPNGSSMLDITSTTKGVLIPRMTTSDRNLISSPATGLMVYNTSTNAFNYWNGSTWIAMSSVPVKELVDADGDTKVQVEATPDNDLVQFTSGGNLVAMFNSRSLQLFTPGNNTYIGQDVGNNDNGTAASNVVVGANSGTSITSAVQNTIVGSSTGENLMTGMNNTFMGFGAGNTNTASDNTFIGSSSGEFNATGTRNVFVGKEAGRMSTANDNTFIGFQSGKATTTGVGNTFVGQGTGDVNTTASNNTFVGNDAGGANTTGTANTYIGQGAGDVSTTAMNNTFVGKDAGGGNTTGSSNTFLGQGAGDVNTIAGNNTFVGKDAGGANTTGSANTFLGQGAGDVNTVANNNTFIGKDAGGANVSGTSNTFIGTGAGLANTASSNTFVGSSAGNANTTGQNNTFLGVNAGFANATSSGNTFLGSDVAASNTIGSQNTMVGSGAGSNNMSGHRNNVMGFAAGENMNSGSDNIFVGVLSGFSADSSGQTIAIGTQAGETNVVSGNTFVGHFSGQANSTGRRNTFLGWRTGDVNSTANDNTFVGSNAGGAMLIGNANTFLGSGAGDVSTSSDNTFIGKDAGGGNTTGAGNVYIGKDAGRVSTTATENVFVGTGAGNTNTGGGKNTFIGYNAGFDNTSGTENSLFGYAAGANLINASGNLMLGVSAGFLNTAGTGNVFVGNGAGFNEVGSHKLYIDNNATPTPLIKGDFTADSLQINGRLAVTGKINVDDDASVAKKGDIRWNIEEEDFEGFDGNEWLSFTRSNNLPWGDGSTGVGNVTDYCSATSSENIMQRYFGRSCSMDGNYAVIGSPTISGAAHSWGSAHIFFRSGLGWMEQDRLTPSDSTMLNLYGESVSISGDYAAVGAPNDDPGGMTNNGAVYIFLRSGTVWTQQAKITITEGAQTNLFFGNSVDIAGDYLIVGAKGVDVSGALNQGRAYIFIRSGTSWTLQATLTASDGLANDFFGTSVAIYDDKVIVGAPEDDGTQIDEGSAYVFHRSGTVWSQADHIQNPFHGAADKFGEAVDINASRAIIGSKGRDVGGNANQGYLHLFQLSGATDWVEVANTTVSGAVQLGYSVSLYGDYILSGTPFSDVIDNCNNTFFTKGKAFLFHFKNNMLDLNTVLVDPNGLSGDNFGVSCSLSGERLVVGAWETDVNSLASKGKVVFGRID